MSERAEEWPTLKLIERNQSLPRLLRAMAASDNAKDRGHDLILSVAADIVEGSASTIRTLTAQIEREKIIATEAVKELERVMERENETRAVMGMLLLCGELGGKRIDEAPQAYLRRLIDAVIDAESSLASLRERVRPVIGMLFDAAMWAETFEGKTLWAREARTAIQRVKATLPHDGEGI